ncbi:MAG: NUDIX domain-containing protein [Candidatus Pacebacteria bacterium]|nr:NUDIX domain-containing protein [Candidatus Paceibacterota bacterium]
MNKYKNKFELCVRAIIQDDDRILVCKRKDKDYYFFPGGHIDFGESAESALVRELKEELNISIKKLSFIGTVENIFIQDNEKHHEINLVFNVLVAKAKDKSEEDHIDFFFFDKKRFLKEEVLPIALQKTVIKWLENKKMFWASQIDKDF